MFISLTKLITKSEDHFYKEVASREEFFNDEIYVFPLKNI